MIEPREFDAFRSSDEPNPFEVVLMKHPRPAAPPVDEPPRPAEVDAPAGSLHRGDPGHTSPHRPKHRKARPRMSMPRIPYVKGGPIMNGDYPFYQPRTGVVPLEEQPQPVELTSMKMALHPYQWVVYTVVLITCLAVLFGMIELYLFIERLHAALQEFGNGLQSAGG